MRIWKALGFAFVLVGLVLGVLSLLGAVDLPAGFLVLPTVGAVLMLIIVLRAQRER